MANTILDARSRIPEAAMAESASEEEGEAGAQKPAKRKVFTKKTSESKGHAESEEEVKGKHDVKKSPKAEGDAKSHKKETKATAERKPSAKKASSPRKIIKGEESVKE